MKFTVIAFFAFLLGATAQENNDSNSSSPNINLQDEIEIIKKQVVTTNNNYLQKLNSIEVEIRELISDQNKSFSGKIEKQAEYLESSLAETNKSIRDQLNTLTQELSLREKELEKESLKYKNDLKSLSKDVEEKLISLNSKISDNNRSLLAEIRLAKEEAQEFASAQVLRAEKNSSSLIQRLSEKQESLSEELNSFDWKGFLLITLCAAIVIKLIFSQSEIRHLRSKTDNLSTALSTLDQKTWEKLTSTLEKIQSDDEGKASVSLSASKSKEEKPHTLQLAVFNEIERIEARLTKYDESDKNRKPMMKALERLEETLSELGYEREKLIGAKYVEGKNYEARFIPSKDPAHETPTITRVYKPSIFHNDKLIQRGEVEVSECE